MFRFTVLFAAFLLAMSPVSLAPAQAQSGAHQKKQQNAAAAKRVQQQRPAQQRAAPQRATQQRATPQRATQQRATQQRATQQRATQQRATQQRATQQKATQQKAIQQRDTRQKATEQRAVRQKAQQEKAQQQKDQQLRSQQQRQEKTQQRNAQQQQKIQQQQQQRAQEREKRQQQLQQRQQAQKAQREHAVKQKTLAEQRARQRQSASKQRVQQHTQRAQQLKLQRDRRAEVRRQAMAQDKRRWIDRRSRWRERPRLTRNYVRSIRFVTGLRYYGGGWYARRAFWSPWRAWRFGYVAAFVPWGGPVFWPYVYDDVFTYTFWPTAYDPGFWGYAYDDLVDSAFYPADASYAEETDAVAPPPPPATVGARLPAAPSTPPRAEQVCGSGITAWPIERIERAVQPAAEQQDLLDALRESAKDAAIALKDACPTTTAATPPERMLATVERLEATLEAVKIVRAPLSDFYLSLSDEQKSKFDAAMAPKVSSTQLRPAQEPQETRCSDAKAGLATFPIQQMEEALKPNEDQQFLLDDLEEAATKAIDVLQSACPDVTPATPVERLETMEKRLAAMVEAAKIMQPAVEDLYAALSDEQQARYSSLGRQVAR